MDWLGGVVLVVGGVEVGWCVVWIVIWVDVD